jgi:hypothetical protein
MQPLRVRNWFENKREGPVMLKVQVTNKEKKKVKVRVGLQIVGEEANVRVPESMIKERFFDADTKCILHLEKVDPRKPWGSLKINVEAVEIAPIP